MRRHLIPAILATVVALPAGAQDRGGVNLLPEALAVGGPRGLARPLLSALPSIGAADLQNTAMPTRQERQQRHQNMIARLRGDGGLLAGFSQGEPLAGSLQPVQQSPVIEQIFAPTINRTVIRNRFEAPVAITRGNNNLVQQQGTQIGGTIASQQVANIGTAAGGSATNVAAPGGRTGQQASGPRRSRQGAEGGPVQRQAALQR